jgi:hypothetical protein
VKSAVTQGSTFSVYLPLAEVVPATAAQPEGPPPPGSGERVLLVDNESRSSR